MRRGFIISRLWGHGEQVDTAWRLLGYTASLIIAAGTIGLNLWLSSLGIAYPFIGFSLGIVLSGWLLGFGPSLVTAGVCAFAAMAFLGIRAPTTTELALYTLASLGICLIVGQQRLTRLALERTVGELNRANERAEQAREASERSNEAKERFLHMISHELRAPLQSITIAAHVLRTQLSHSENLAVWLGRIDLAIHSLANMIDDLVDSTRIITGQLRLNVEKLDLALVVRSAIEMMAPIAEEKQIKLLVDINARDLLMLGDPERLRQCVCNLLGNAIKFSAMGTEVRVSLGRTSLGVELRVTDKGEGIEAEFLPRVFERFAQAGSTTQRRGGLGLGLSITRHIVELHGGKIAAYSEGRGRGSSFVILLPRTN